MARNYKASGRHLPITSASAAITSGAFVYQEGLIGIALTSANASASLQIANGGVWEIPVPSSTVKGEILYANLGGGGEAASLVLSRTATTTDPVAQAITSRDAAGNALVLIASNPIVPK
jgi:predicted RecA/RadA family phage recombinase